MKRTSVHPTSRLPPCAPRRPQNTHNYSLCNTCPSSKAPEAASRISSVDSLRHHPASTNTSVGFCLTEANAPTCARKRPRRVNQWRRIGFLSVHRLNYRTNTRNMKCSYCWTRRGGTGTRVTEANPLGEATVETITWCVSVAVFRAIFLAKRPTMHCAQGRKECACRKPRKSSLVWSYKNSVVRSP